MELIQVIVVAKRCIGPNGFVLYTNNTIERVTGYTWGIQVLPTVYAVQGMVHADYETTHAEVAAALVEQILIRRAESPGLFGG